MGIGQRTITTSDVLVANLRLFTSNRLEILTGLLEQVLRTPLASVLDREIIVVQSKGMERWVSMELARRHGISANYRFPFPNTLVYEVFRKVLQDLPERSPFDPDILTWRIMKLLPGLIMKPGFDTLANYLGDTGKELKRIQLSERIADTFDQYLLFRPQMVLRWEQGEKSHWQAVLWRALVDGKQKNHRAALGKAFLEALDQSTAEIRDFPERVSIFGISALPRFHMQVLAAISRFTEVNLFLMNPCREYWGDIVSDRAIQMVMDRQARYGLNKEELHLEQGNSLLASMGMLGRDFFDLVNELNCEEMSSFAEPGTNHLLAMLQSDILNLQDRGRGPTEKKSVSNDDKSIQIHSCHSPGREMEVLHDQLLDMFEREPTLLPKDILVMAPNIETYAAYIQAVFDAPFVDPKRIPFTIADRSIRQEGNIIDTFFAILDLNGGRFVASEVVAILESLAVQRKFALSEADLELIIKWVRATGIRWGIDGQSRGELGLPPFKENTWMAGLERLLLGYAMPGQEENLFGGVLPYDHIEGAEALVLGKFVDFTQQLFTQVTSLSSPRTLDQWSEDLTELLDRFFMPDEDTEGEMQAIRRLLKDLGDTAEEADFQEEIGIEVIKWQLGHHLESTGFGFGFITGGVTFCAMLPMRSIPFKIICLVGMNGEAYPRESRPLGFDLLAKDPQPGDRSRRNDDRYLFLEAVLSARETLYISYVGQSIQDSSPLPPSVLVSELSDYIEQGFEIRDGDILDSIQTIHRLQAFSPKYFNDDEKLFSYSKDNFRVAEQAQQPREDRPPLIGEGLAEPGAEWKTVELGDLCSFWSNPAKYLLRKRLGIYLEERTSPLEETESLELSKLEKYLLEQVLLERKLAGGNLEGFLPVIRACGQLPHGAVGKCVYESLSYGVESFVKHTERYMEGECLAAFEVDLDISGFKLSGRIDGIYPEGLLRYRYARAKAKDHVRLWIHHLVLNAMATDRGPQTSWLAALHPRSGKPCLWQYRTVKNCEEVLGELLGKYWLGLVKPLHFFPESSWDYAQTLLGKNRSEEEALRTGRKTWAGNDFKPGESKDLYYQLCFGRTDPLDKEFQDLSRTVLGAVFVHLEEIGT
ncbi:MAG: exodeoxyribonuclease V subunit gamma [Deltaproteobacteria bacterium]|nr:MAG: exodeoxyribonuclease V subunit gamma [Deltaproteobacteria bacterium]